MFASLRRRVLGQSGSEYMMVISVVTIAVVGAAFAFVPRFRDGTITLGNEVKEILGSGSSDNRGVASATGSNGSNGGTPTGSSDSTGGMGSPTDPTAPGGTSTGGSGNGGTAQAPGANRDTRYQRNNQNCFFGICFGTRETAVSGGTGGGGGELTVADGQAAALGEDSKVIDGAWKSFFQGDVSKAAANASDALKNKPICGPAIIAALTGQSVDAVYKQLEDNGRLALVKKETVVAGVVVNTEYTTTGVMSQSQLAEALREDYGFRVGEKFSGATMGDVNKALAQGKTPIVLMSDSKTGDANAGDFGVVTDVVPGMGVKIDSSTGSYWIPQSEFERRMGVMGGRLVTVSPPKNNNRSVARGP